VTGLIRYTGYIIKRKNFSEVDKIITVFSKEQGIITLTAKGIRRIKSRRAPHLELFNLVEIRTHKRTINEAKIIKDYRDHKSDLKTVGYLYYIFETLSKVLPENVPHPEIFELTAGFLEGAIDEEGVKSLMIKIVWDLGYLPPGELPKVGVTTFIESIAERKIHSKRFLEKIVD